MVQMLALPDGRTLEYLTGGDPDGFAFLFHSGTPSAAVRDPLFWSAAQRAGLHLVTYSRPGYGASTARPIPAGWPVPVVADAADAASLLDHLGMGEFVTLGWSGGGPRALACAALLPDRCLAAASLAGVAPYDGEGLDWMAGMAEELGLPLVTVIDTPGAELSPDAEERAIAGEIARCIATLTTMKVPTVSVILGQGCGGGALAFLPARTVIATEHAWLSPLPPEGASVIVHGDVEHAAEMAQRQRVRATDLLADGIVQHVVPEIDGEPASSLAVAVAARVSALLLSLIHI